MGIGLRLYPLRGPSEMGESEVLCVDSLTFEADYRVFAQLCDASKEIAGEFKEALEGRELIRTFPIPPQMWVLFYEDEGSSRTREDQYDQELTFAYARDLKKLVVPPDSSAKNKAIKAFIEALPEDAPIILMWR